MRIGYQRRRLADFAGGMRLARELAEREPKERLRQHQQESLEKLVRHAIEHSLFYRERLSGEIGSYPIELTRLPVMDKARIINDRGALRPRVRTSRRHPPLRGHSAVRERGRGGTASGSRRAGRQVASHQLPQPRAADHKAGGLGCPHYRAGALPVRTDARPGARDRGPQRRRAPAPRPERRLGEGASHRVWLGDARPREGPVTAKGSRRDDHGTAESGNPALFTRRPALQRVLEGSTLPKPAQSTVSYKLLGC